MTQNSLQLFSKKELKSPHILRSLVEKLTNHKLKIYTLLLLLAFRFAWYHWGSKGRQGARSASNRGRSDLQSDLHRAGRAETSAAQETHRTRVGGLRPAAQQGPSQHCLPQEGQGRHQPADSGKKQCYLGQVLVTPANATLHWGHF